MSAALDAPLTVLVGTWNVNAKYTKIDLEYWLRASGSGVKKPDVVVAGLQEMVPLDAMHVAVQDVSARKAAAKWAAILEAVMDRQGDYCLLAQCHLVGVFISVYVKEALLPRVWGISTAVKACGLLGGQLGNKGGCAVRFGIDNTTLCFLSAHLAAHRDQQGLVPSPLSPSDPSIPRSLAPSLPRSLPPCPRCTPSLRAQSLQHTP